MKLKRAVLSAAVLAGMAIPTGVVAATVAPTVAHASISCPSGTTEQDGVNIESTQDSEYFAKTGAQSVFSADQTQANSDSFDLCYTTVGGGIGGNSNLYVYDATAAKWVEPSSLGFKVEAITTGTAPTAGGAGTIDYTCTGTAGSGQLQAEDNVSGDPVEFGATYHSWTDVDYAGTGGTQDTWQLSSTSGLCGGLYLKDVTKGAWVNVTNEGSVWRWNVASTNTQGNAAIVLNVNTDEAVQNLYANEQEGGNYGWMKMSGASVETSVTETPSPATWNLIITCTGSSQEFTMTDDSYNGNNYGVVDSGDTYHSLAAISFGTSDTFQFVGTQTLCA